MQWCVEGKCVPWTLDSIQPVSGGWAEWNDAPSTSCGSGCNSCSIGGQLRLRRSVRQCNNPSYDLLSKFIVPIASVHFCSSVPTMAVAIAKVRPYVRSFAKPRYNYQNGSHLIKLIVFLAMLRTVSRSVCFAHMSTAATKRRHS